MTGCLIATWPVVIVEGTAQTDADDGRPGYVGLGARGIVECQVKLGDLVTKMVAFVRAGYPHGVPDTDYIPLLALLRRRLSDDEVAAVAQELATRGELNSDIADIGAAITRITDELPSPAEVERVKRRLEAIGWPGGPGSVG